MKLISFLSNLMIPLTVFLIVVYGAIKKVDIFAAFLEGAKDGILTVFNILPALIGLICAVNLLRASGVMEFIAYIIPDAFGIPADIFPLAFMRLISSSAATGMLLDIFKVFGPDSFIGRLSSVMMGCTETVFYTITVYFAAAGIKEGRYTLIGALLANFAGIVASFYIVKAFF